MRDVTREEWDETCDVSFETGDVPFERWDESGDHTMGTGREPRPGASANFHGLERGAVAALT